jgi:hypothetical protein
MVASEIQMLTLQARIREVYIPLITAHADVVVVQIVTCTMISLERDNNTYWSVEYHSSYAGLGIIASLSLIFSNGALMELVRYL